MSVEEENNRKNARMKSLLPLIYIICFHIIFLSACTDKRHQLHSELFYIESLSDEKPDSAAMLLHQFAVENRGLSQADEAYYNLLQTKTNILLKASPSDSIINTVINYYENNEDEHKLALAYYYKSQISMSLEADSIAMVYILKTIDKVKMTNNLQLLSNAYNHLGFIYLMQNLPSNALQAFKKAYEYTDQLPRKHLNKPVYLRNIARAYNLKNILSHNSDKHSYRDSAILFYNKAISLQTDSTPKNISLSIYKELSTTYMLNNDFTKSFKYLEASLDSNKLQEYFNKKAGIFLRMGQFDSASFYVQKCMTDSGLYERYTMYDKLLKIEKQKNNPQKALEYADSLLILSDSMIARTMPEEMIEIQKKYNEEKLRAEKASIEIKYEKEKSHSLLISFIVVVLLFLSTYIYIYSYFKKKKLQQSLLKQRNELLLLNQKARQWNTQVQLSQKKIHQLEDEKKQIESDLHIIANEKELILKEKDEELELYRKQESDLQTQKAKYEELCYVEFKKQFLSVPLYRKIPAFGIERVVTEKLSVHSQKQLMSIMDEICYSFASRLHVLLQESTEKTCLCCLIRLEVKPKYIMILCDLSKETYYKQCQRIAESLIGKSSASALREYLSSF